MLGWIRGGVDLGIGGTGNADRTIMPERVGDAHDRGIDFITHGIGSDREGIGLRHGTAIMEAIIDRIRIFIGGLDPDTHVGEVAGMNGFAGESSILEQCGAGPQIVGTGKVDDCLGKTQRRYEH